MSVSEGIHVLGALLGKWLTAGAPHTARPRDADGPPGLSVPADSTSVVPRVSTPYSGVPDAPLFPAPTGLLENAQERVQREKLSCLWKSGSRWEEKTENLHPLTETGRGGGGRERPHICQSWNAMDLNRVRNTTCGRWPRPRTAGVPNRVSPCKGKAEW